MAATRHSNLMPACATPGPVPGVISDIAKGYPGFFMTVDITPLMTFATHSRSHSDTSVEPVAQWAIEVCGAHRACGAGGDIARRAPGGAAHPKSVSCGDPMASHPHRALRRCGGDRGRATVSRRARHPSPSHTKSHASGPRPWLVESPFSFFSHPVLRVS